MVGRGTVCARAASKLRCGTTAPAGYRIGSGLSDFRVLFGKCRCNDRDAQPPRMQDAAAAENAAHTAATGPRPDVRERLPKVHAMTADTPGRDELAAMYLEQLPYEPYRVQEEALLAWFTSTQGVMVCAPTGMGKTLIAEAALFEALHNGSVAYYTTPLIALTDQKFYEMQDSAVRWGFRAEDVGLVTGNRRINPDARSWSSSPKSCSTACCILRCLISPRSVRS